MMLYKFLQKNQEEILFNTEKKTLELAGDHPSSIQLKQGLPIFYKQILGIIKNSENPGSPPAKNIGKIADAADRCDEPAMAQAAGRPEEAELAQSSGLHGSEMLRLGYTLSHVVHAYGALCQAVTEAASKKKTLITASEFHALNRCLDVAIAGAVTSFQSHCDSQGAAQEGKTAEFLTREMRSALLTANAAFLSIHQGTVGVGGSTARLVFRSLERLGELVDRLEDELANRTSC
jgi:hypothetical protein